jgi:hypothetical protein
MTTRARCPGRIGSVSRFNEAGVLARVTVEFVDPWDAESDGGDDR